ncbi:MAG TPA: class I SAM-dependent methyltransferase [Syntrophales bacterium]|jgi:ubiquinone/menaquinone biosynthesis C-methylase UbiE|nr:class I SAM-dependent methyltransferase [Syntrophales bacterium]HOU77517.1 class I SAM-dependent methyltransferase [Syntrophales bacterium]HPC31941.1 class I SAM-dependent methyltransferase [Syntrophales bacterium]HQI36429.1 class I SAM-dependent methyltransferase [Syntrophales bacterium]HRR46600.1 class I SAM-dependent methyltransferase [Syntrophales bacterium]
MNKNEQLEQVSEVFTGVEAHLLTAELIRDHSTNSQDIRELALAGLTWQDCRRVLDLGCGFGFFTEALRNRLPPGAGITGLDMIPGYEPLFLDVCRRVGAAGRFIAAPVAHIETLPERSWDLILCSYALYFFPEMTGRIARLLSPGGVFVTITHAARNMGELFAAAKAVLKEQGILKRRRLPVEEIIGRFCAENGAEFLGRWFGRIEVIDYPNTLIFRPDELPLLLSYFRFKTPFFLAGIEARHREGLMARFAVHLEDAARKEDGFRIFKDDRIFICREPRPGKDRPGDENGKAVQVPSTAVQIRSKGGTE